MVPQTTNKQPVGAVENRRKMATKNSPLHVELWSETAMEDKIYFQLIVLEQSLFAWVGSSKGEMQNLAVGIKTPMDESSTVTTLMGQEQSGDFGFGLSQRLSKRFNSIVFVSYNLSRDKDYLEMFIEASLIKKIKSLSNAPPLTTTTTTTTSTPPSSAPSTTPSSIPSSTPPVGSSSNTNINTTTNATTSTPTTSTTTTPAAAIITTGTLATATTNNTNSGSSSRRSSNNGKSGPPVVTQARALTLAVGAGAACVAAFFVLRLLARRSSSK